MKRTFDIISVAALSLMLLAAAACGTTGVSDTAALLARDCPSVSEVTLDTSSVLAPGVGFSGLYLKTSENEPQHICLVEIAPDSGYGLNVVLPDHSVEEPHVWNRETLTSMADSLTAEGLDVVAMTNADFWDLTEPVNPRGPVHCSGEIFNDGWDYSDKVPQQALSFAGILSDGTPVIRDRACYDGLRQDLVECTGAGVVMLADSELQDVKYTFRDPRTAVGYCPDGTIWLLTADGRGFAGASGLTYREMGEIFKALGCVYAANLDGGGSAQMLVRDPETRIHHIANTPADGKERPVISGLAIIKKKK